jgi:hypothetical protein
MTLANYIQQANYIVAFTGGLSKAKYRRLMEEMT